MTERRETGLMFKAAMVNAIIPGWKTVTRRICAPHVVEAIEFLGGHADGGTATEDDFTLRWGMHKTDRGKVQPACWLIESAEYPEEGVIPIGRGYGNVGDLIYGKETYRLEDSIIHYRADGLLLPSKMARADRAMYANRWRRGDHGLKWKSAMFMPRDYSRLDLELISVRIERLHAITEDDAKAEGAEPAWGPDPANEEQPTYRHGFMKLWQSINGEESWAINPWVWRLEFTRRPLQ